MASAALSPARRLLLLPSRWPSSSPTICAAAAAAARRHYVVSRQQINREMERNHRLAASRGTGGQSLSEMQRVSRSEYFKDGKTPLFPSASCPAHCVVVSGLGLAVTTDCCYCYPAAGGHDEPPDS